MPQKSKKTGSSKSEEKSLLGRPTKYKKDFHPSEAIRLSKTFGYTHIQMCSEWDIDETQFYRWVKRHALFRQSVKRAKMHREAYFTKFFMNIAAGKVKNANVTALIFTSKNTIDWKDKKEISVGDDIDDLEFVDF